MEIGPDDPPAEGSCHFFELSAELRNLVYEYVLTGKRPLRFKRTSNGGRLLFQGPLEANQLRFVNKQLFTETRNLELQYNDLDFHNIKDAGFFLQRCASTYWPQLRILTIQNTVCWTPNVTEKAAMQSIVVFCKQYPRALVKARLSELSPNYPGTLMHIGQGEYEARGTKTLFNSMYPESAWEEKLSASVVFWPRRPCMKLYHDISALGDNFRIYPKEEALDETKLREEYVRLEPYFQEVFHAAGGADGVIKAMKHLVEHGI